MKTNLKTMSVKQRALAFVAASALLTGGAVAGVYADNGVGTLPVVYLDGVHGNDENAGTKDLPVKSLAKAEELAASNATIIVSDTVDITNANQTFDVKAQTFKRGDGFAGPLLRISDSTVTMKGEGATFDGEDKSADAPLLTFVGSTVNVNGVNLTGGHNNNNKVSGQIPTDNWSGMGGAIGARQSTVNLSNTNIAKNEATLGGGLFADGSTITVDNGAIFDANKAFFSDPAQGARIANYAAGAGIFAVSVHGNSTINVEPGAKFTNNDALSGSVGGAISTGRIYAGDASTQEDEYTFNLEGSTTINVLGGDFIGNKAGVSGGAIFVQRTDIAYVTGGHFESNHSDSRGTDFSGGAIYVQGPGNHGSDVGKVGEGLAAAKLVLKNALITDNTAQSGGGLALCDTGDGFVGYAEGAAIYGNNAEEWGGQDVHIARTDGAPSTTTLSRMALGNVPNQWVGKNGEGEDIDPYYIAPGTSDKRRFFTNGLTAKDVDASLARVTFVKNSTNRLGGAIAVNGELEIGEQVGAFYLKKIDSATKAPLGGAQFRLTGPNNYDVTVTTVSDKQDAGIAAFRDLLPGSYKLVETKAPAAYPHLNLDWSVEVSEGSDGFIVTIRDTDGQIVSPSSTRSDVAGNVYGVFELTNDKFGHPELKTQAVNEETGTQIANPDDAVTIIDTVHYTNVVPGEKYYVKGTLVDKSTGEPVLAGGKPVTAQTTPSVFEKAEGDIKVTFGPFNASELASKTTVVFEELWVVDADGDRKLSTHADVNDQAQTITFTGKPGIGTSARDSETEANIAPAGAKRTIIDTVTYTNLKAGKVYTLKAQLVKKSDGTKIADAEHKFTAKEANGSVDVAFKDVDTSKLAGDALVAYEYLYLGDVTGKDVNEKSKEYVTKHEDINDAAQTVFIPAVETEAADANTGNKYSKPADDGTIAIVDRVHYTGLIPGKEYSVRGTLMDQATGEALAIDGANVVLNFTPETSNGYVDVTFTMSAAELKTNTVVVFENVYYNGKLVAAHADIEDENQTVYIPEIGTEASGKDTKDHIVFAGDKVEIVDVVAYRGLVPGASYTLDGKLVRKSNGDEVASLDKHEVTASDKGTGTWEITFTVDARDYAGDALVAYEYLSAYVQSGEVTVPVVIAEHADINSQEQTVYVPSVTTEASDKADGNNIVEPKANMTVVDVVTFTNLIPGKEYTVNGELHKRVNGDDAGVVEAKSVKAVAGDGATVQDDNARTFVADKANGSVTLEFVVDASKLAGEQVVVFETVKQGEVTVAVHTDITDDAQTVEIGKKPEIGTVATDKDDDDKLLTYGDAVVVDTVEYKNLVAEREYTLKGQLVKKSDGTVVATGERAFKPAQASGKETIEFAVNTADLYGERLVAFEYLYEGNYEGKDVAPESEDLVAEHAKLESDTQYVDVVEKPEVTTNARGDKEDETVKSISPKEDMSIYDVVTFKNLIPGKEYSLDGELHKRVNGEDAGVVEAKSVKAVAGDGATVQDDNARTFVADKANGSVTLEFVVDASELAGEEIVVFESLKHNGVEIAAHVDIKDDNQLVTVNPKPKPGHRFEVVKVAPRENATDSDNQYKDLAGAKLEVRVGSPKGDVLTVEASEDCAVQTETHAWTSDGKPHVVEVCEAGVYYVVETQAPQGYKIAEPIKVEVTDTGDVFVNDVLAEGENHTVTVVDMPEDKDVPPTPSPTPSATTDVPRPSTDGPSSVATPTRSVPLPVTGLPLTGAMIGAVATLAVLFFGAGITMVRRRDALAKD